MPQYNIIAGTTTAIQFQLLSGGAPIVLTGYTVTLLLTNKLGVTVATPGTVTVTDAPNGKVQLAPTDATIFIAANSPYSARWKLVDGSAKISYVPSGPRDVWNIVEA